MCFILIIQVRYPRRNIQPAFASDLSYYSIPYHYPDRRRNEIYRDRRIIGSPDTLSDIIPYLLSMQPLIRKSVLIII